MPANWDRLDAYPMFTEAFDYIVATNDGETADVEVIKASPLLVHRGALGGDEDEARLSKAGIDPTKAHQVESCHDLDVLIRANLGVGVAPTSALQSAGLRHVRCPNLDLSRQIAIYTVAGRRRSREAAAFLTLVRSADWSEVGSA
jgi:DNA-binding transcriptional LysR family regulator